MGAKLSPDIAFTASLYVVEEIYTFKRLACSSFGGQKAAIMVFSCFYRVFFGDLAFVTDQSRTVP